MLDEHLFDVKRTAPDLEKVLEEAEALRKAGPEGPRTKKAAEPPQ